MRALTDFVEGLSVLVFLCVWVTVIVFILADTAGCPVSLTSLWGEMIACAIGVGR